VTIDGEHRSGLEAMFRHAPLARLLGIELVEWDGGRARLRWVPGPDHCNIVGVVHGGALFSLADAGLEVASNSWGRVCVALFVDAQFHSPARQGEALIAEARERSRSRRAAGYLIDVVAEADPSQLRASFQATVFRTADWHLGPGTWTDSWKSTH
jgi:acyl-CoA thioesterase